MDITYVKGATRSRFPHLIEAALERIPVLLRLLERHAQLKQRDDRILEVREKCLVVARIQLRVLAEALVFDELHVRGQHHQRLRLDVLELLGAVPLLVGPLLLEQQLEVVVGHGGGREGPGPVVPRAIGVAAPERVGAGQRDHFLVGEAHAPEDGADVAAVFARVGEAPVRRTEADVPVGAPRAVGDLGALHFLDRGHAAEDPEVRVGYPGEGFLDGREEVAGSNEAGVGAVVAFGGEAHGGAVGAASVGELVIAVVVSDRVYRKNSRG
jgi:hypothetical protein